MTGQPGVNIKVATTVSAGRGILQPGVYTCVYNIGSYHLSDGRVILYYSQYVVYNCVYVQVAAF